MGHSADRLAAAFGISRKEQVCAQSEIYLKVDSWDTAVFSFIHFINDKNNGIWDLSTSVICIKEFNLCFQKLVGCELHTLSSVCYTSPIKSGGKKRMLGKV